MYTILPLASQDKIWDLAGTKSHIALGHVFIVSIFSPRIPAIMVLPKSCTWNAELHHIAGRRKGAGRSAFHAKIIRGTGHQAKLVRLKGDGLSLRLLDVGE